MTVKDNRIYNNVAEVERGGGMFITSCPDLRLIGNSIYGNEGTGGGGLYFWSTSLGTTVAHNEVYSNTAGGGGGIYFYNSSGVTVDSNEVYSNTASNGGGIFLYGGTDLILRNNILWANEATNYGAGIRVQDAGVQFLHTTIARNVGDGIAVVAGSLRMTNTILARNTVGVRVWSNCTATLANTLWGDGVWANTDDWVLQDGTSILDTGTANYWEAPAFVDPDAGDYHIGPTSGAIDRGVHAGVSRDIDDEPRLGVPDLGADEYVVPGTIFKYVYLPLILRIRAVG